MLAIGETVEVQGSGAKPYTLKNVDGLAWSCTCMSWRNQKVRGPRTCKHLKLVNGEAYEAARCQGGALIKEAVAEMIAIEAKSTVMGTGKTCEACGANTPYTDWTKCEKCLVPKLTTGSHSDSKSDILHTPAVHIYPVAPRPRMAGLLLAETFADDFDTTGWWWSEKLDGVRAYWNGQDFVSREGNVFPCNPKFKKSMPDHPLDGELYMGRGKLEETISVLRSGNWDSLKYMAFDMPHLKVKFEDRMAALMDAVSLISTGFVHYHTQIKLTSKGEVHDLLKQYAAMGAEGLMIRKPGSLYEGRRSSTLYKVKPYENDEAIVIAHKMGKGKHAGTVGGLEVRMPDGKTFSFGSGLTEKDRVNPPPIGTKITYRFTGKTNRGIPKCASYVGRRDYE